MTKLRAKAWLVFDAVCITIAVTQMLKPTVYMTDKLGKPELETLFPLQFADWRLDANAAVVLPSPETQALLNKIYNQTLTRTYVNASGYRIMLSVAYGGDQSDGTRAHLPERCYPAQGFQISVNVVDQLQLGDRLVGVRRLMSKQGRRSEPITYWLLVGDQVTTSGTDQKLAQFKLGLKGLIPDGMLVRVSSIDRDMSHGHQMQSDFLIALANAIPNVDRARIFGKQLI
jgi:EpsI family protein